MLSGVRVECGLGQVEDGDAGTEHTSRTPDRGAERLGCQGNGSGTTGYTCGEDINPILSFSSKMR